MGHGSQQSALMLHSRFFLSSRNAPVGLRDDKKKGCETDCVGQWKVVFKKMERLYDLWIAVFVE